MLSNHYLSRQEHTLCRWAQNTPLIHTGSIFLLPSQVLTIHTQELLSFKDQKLSPTSCFQRHCQHQHRLKQSRQGRQGALQHPQPHLWLFQVKIQILSRLKLALCKGSPQGTDNSHVLVLTQGSSLFDTFRSTSDSPDPVPPPPHLVMLDVVIHCIPFFSFLWS